MSAATRLRHFSTGSASFVVTFPVDDLELATSWTQTALSGTSIRSRSTLSWPARRSAITAFPALIPRPTLVRDAVAARVGEEGPAYMFYTGCTIADTPVSPAADELAPAAAMRAPTEDEKQVLDGLTKRYRDLDTAHTAAAATGSLVAVVKALCPRPVRAPPPSYATYVATVPVDKIDEAPAGVPEGLVWYERQITFGGIAELLARLEQAIAA
ncbi:hypothetical protein A1Q1_03122 [Trichosporon asahii var. asahii CBS 2479]|uniref:Uncharacterized protein n=1 Tax=Trichosporon asahii var. asahii (strain ATCC 90039 / CBS 2479 / JCM 2466 / KCTC 7840 / NBRC 103889/ NCYC 2677 / UAMH 7654) TaxID=1186058 RepID=J5RHG2_TRIAS|nr:hypothetical protein A1Q1_03122 [Trichosporon asahii var. asahii CBS 2479]EJT52668.1 hypothetical protein A1Q1_03122 [Trichosporon asahii var. asahii CBS 2479]